MTIYSNQVFLLLILLTGLPIFSLGQAVDSFPRLQPSNVTAYDLDDGMPISCAWDGLVDNQGRFWATPCFGQTEHRTINFYQFDGRRSEVIEWEELPEGAEGQAGLAGITKKGELYGFFRGSGHFFLFDPGTRRTRFYEIEEKGAVIFFMEESPDHGLILLAATPERQYIYRLREDSIEGLFVYQPEVTSGLPVDFYNFQPHFQTLSGDYLWFFETPDLYGMDSITKDNFKVLRFSFRDRRLQEYSYDDLFSASPPAAGTFRHRVALAPGPGGKVVLGVFGHLYRIDPEHKETELLGVFPHQYNFTDNLNYSAYYRIERDSVGNLLFIFPDLRDQYIGILLDTAGQYHDYTAVLKGAVAASRFPEYFHHNVWSKDFKREVVVFHPGGIIAVDLQFYGSITNHLTGSPTRAINAWRPNEYLVRPENHNTYYILRPFSGAAPELLREEFEFEMEYHPLSLSDLIVRDDGYWYSSGEHLVRMDNNQQYTSFPTGFYFVRFTFLDRRTAVMVGRDRRLYRYDWTTRQVRTWKEQDHVLEFRGDVNEMYVARDSTLWIATLHGLWQIDLKEHESRKHGLPDGFLDERIMCIHEDERGRLWLGTYGNGLHIYDPQTGAIEVVNQEKGLSNNTVIGILSDKEGVRWVSTYKGLNLVSDGGAVLAQLYKEDGLSTNEFNRYSYFKDARGRMLFGSIKGVNLIEPELVKRQLRGTGDLQIYLTSLTRYDGRKGSDSTQYFGFDQLSTIQLPATHRYLDLHFALSDLIRPEDQNFAYQIERSNQPNPAEWVFLGSKTQLYLPDLSPGRYTIRIRGSDYRGNWAAAPIVLPVLVRGFFYQQAWFYALIFCLLAGAAFAWIHRQRILRKQLEVELAERTTEIMAARDQLIVQEKLASLGQMVAGIAHEIKNPLNFIHNFSIGSQEVLEELNEELRDRPSDSKQELVSKVSTYVELLRENIETIRESGDRMDAVVSSMMNHARDSSEERVAVEINDLVELNVNLAYQAFKSKHEGFRVEQVRRLDASNPVLHVFPNDLDRCLLNLTDNACYAVYEKTKKLKGEYEPVIEIATIDRPDEVEIRLRDNGSGMKTELKEKIFTPFFTTKPTGTGNIGLGLSICHDIIVKRHGGSLRVESEEGAYTEFIISLPKETTI